MRMLHTGQPDIQDGRYKVGSLELRRMHTIAMRRPVTAADWHDIDWNIAFEVFCIVHNYCRGDRWCLGLPGSRCRTWMTVNLFFIRCFTATCRCRDCQYLSLDSCFTMLGESLVLGLRFHPRRGTQDFYGRWLTQVASCFKSILDLFYSMETGRYPMDSGDLAWTIKMIRTQIGALTQWLRNEVAGDPRTREQSEAYERILDFCHIRLDQYLSDSRHLT